MNYILDKSRLEVLALADETQMYKGDLVAQMASRLLESITRVEAAEKVIRGMYPLWIAAMSYAEHGRAADLDRIRNYYNGRDNPMSAEDIHLMLSLMPEKEGK